MEKQEYIGFSKYMLANGKYASADFLYGPYDSVEDGLRAVPSEYRVLGRTMGIITDGSVKEYWFKSGILDSDLVPKIFNTSDFATELSAYVTKADLSSTVTQLQDSITSISTTFNNSLSSLGSDINLYKTDTDTKITELETRINNLPDGTDLNKVWESLALADSSKRIDISHIPDIPNSKLTQLSDWAKQSVKPSYTTSEITEGTNLYFTDARAVTALGSTLENYIKKSEIGAASGVVPLNSESKIDSTYLPGYVDDVIEFDSLSSFPSVGEKGKIYVAIDTNKEYRWAGTTYAVLSEGTALGETHQTAGYGDWTKAAYNHSLLTSGNPHHVSFSELYGTLDISQIPDLSISKITSLQSKLDSIDSSLISISSSVKTNADSITVLNGRTGIATTTKAGIVKGGGNVNIAADGTLSISSDYYHSHANKSILDSITADEIAWLQSIMQYFTYDSVNNALKSTIDLYSVKGISAYGVSSDSGGSSSGGLIKTVYGYTSLGSTFSDTILTDTFNAYTINKLAERITTIESHPGGVTSIGITVPDGFTVSGSPVTNSGVINISFASGYSVPTIEKQTLWDSAVAVMHSHSNKSVLDSITQDDLNWIHSLLGYISYDASNSAVKITGDLYATSGISAYGQSSSGTSGTGGLIKNVYGYSGLSGTYSDTTLTDTFNAYTIARIAERLSTVESTFLTSVSWNDLKSKPTTIAGFGISDAYTKTDIGNLLSSYALSTSLPTSTQISSWDNAVSLAHSHTNKAALDNITQTQIDWINSLIDKITYDSTNTSVKINPNLYSEGGITAYGTGSVSSGAGGLITAVYGYSDLSKTFSNETLSDTFNAYTIKQIYSGLTSLQSTALTSHQTIYPLTFVSGAFTSATYNPVSGSSTVNIPTTTSHISEGTNLYFTNDRAVSALSSTLSGYSLTSHTHNYLSTLYVGSTAYSVSSNTITIPAYPTSLPASDVYSWAKQSSKPSYSYSEVGAAASSHTHTFSSITSKPTTLSGYGITDAYTKTEITSLLSSYALQSQLPTSEQISHWDTAYTNNHTHSNKSALDNITQAQIDWVNSLIDKISYDSGVKAVKVNPNMYSEGGISAFGSSSGGSSSGGLIQTVYSYSHLSDTLSDTVLTDTFNAYTINKLAERIASLEGGAALTIVTSGTGNALTSVTKTGTVLTFAKDSSFSLVGHTHDYIPLSQRGVADGVATLDSNGLLISSQLPSYVDDVLEVSTYSVLPAVGEAGKIYVTTDTNITYRWTGSTYVEISKSLALGETSSTAYRGDYGALAYAHSLIPAGTGVHISDTERTNWNIAYSNSHTHSNKITLDTINQSLATTSKVTFDTVTASTSMTASSFIGALQGNADTATRLKDTFKLWGQDFYGNNVSGDINGCNNINATGDISLTSLYGSIKLAPTTAVTYINYGDHYLLVDGYSNGRTNLASKAGFPLSISAGATNEQIYLNTDGNVGIGTTSPNYKLDVSGTMRVADTAIFDGNIGTSTYISQSQGWRVTNAGNADFRSVYTDYLRIGNGYLKWDDTNKAFYVIQSDGTTAAGFYATGGISAYGVSSVSGGSGSGLISTLYRVANLTDNTSFNDSSNDTFNAYSIKSIYDSLQSVKAGALTSVDWSIIQNKPTTLSGYNITDVYNKTQVDNQVNAAISTTENYADNAAITAVNNIQIGGRNLLRYSNDFSKWDLNSSYSSITQEGYLKYADNYYNNQYGPNNFVVSESGYYTISFTCVEATSSKIYVEFKNTSSGGQGSKVITVGKNVLTAFIPAGTYGGFSIYGVVTGSNYVVIKNDIMVERANKPSNWSPAPEDVDSAIATKVATTTYDAKMTLIDSAISSKVSQTDFNALGQRVSSAESSISQNATNIELKVAKDGVISAINQTSESVTINASKINLTGAVTFSSLDSSTQGVINAKADTSTVNQQVSNAITTAATDATNKVNAVQIGGTNLFVDGQFKNVAEHTKYKHIVTSDNIDALYIINQGHYTDGGYLYISIGTNKFKQGDVVTVSFDVYPISGQLVCDIDGMINDVPVPSNLTQNAWNRVTGTQTCINATYINLTLYGTSSAPFTGYVTNFTIRKGSKDLGFTPAPEDVDASIQLAQSTAISTAASNAANTYLPLSGGTLTGALITNPNVLGWVFRNEPSWYGSISYDSYGTECLGIMFKDSRTKFKVKAGYDSSSLAGNNAYTSMPNADLEVGAGYAKINGNTVWHAGNDGSGSGLDADMLDGIHANDLFNRYDVGSGSNTYDANNYMAQGYYYSDADTSGTFNNMPQSLNYAGGFGVMYLKHGNYGTQIINAYATNDLYVRNNNYGNGTVWNWSEWKKIALVDDNVASATKLNTARNILGIAFDGTADCNGNASISGTLGVTGLVTANNGITIGNGTKSVPITVDSDGNIVITGNLKVAGNMFATGGVSAYS